MLPPPLYMHWWIFWHEARQYIALIEKTETPNLSVAWLLQSREDTAVRHARVGLGS